MVSFGGAVQAMRASLANNKKLLGERKRYFRNGKEYFEDSLRTKHFEEEFKNLAMADPKLLWEIELTFQKKKESSQTK
jgi:hypothetical protein